MEGNVNGREDSESNDCSPQTKSIVEQRSNEVHSTIDEDTHKCKHFSIRDYVAEIRKKDWKICWPFCSSGEHKEPDDQAEFRCWCCQCLSTSDASDDTADIMSEDKIYEGNVNVTSFEYKPLIDLVRKEKLTRLASNCEIRPDVFASRETKKFLIKTVDEVILQPNSCITKDAQHLNEENFTIDAETKNIDFGRGSGILDGNVSEFDGINLSCQSNCATENHYKDGHAKRVPEIVKMCEKGEESITCNSQQPESDSVENESLDSQASYIRTLSTKTLKCKKPQKVRLLSDILKREVIGASYDLASSNGAANSNDINIRITESETADDSDDPTLDTLFRSQKTGQANTGKTPCCRKKRKRLQVEDLGPSQSRWSMSSGVSEDSQCHKSHKKNNSIKSTMCGFASVSIASSRDVGLVNQAKKRLQKSSVQGWFPSSKIVQENSCQNLQFNNTDLESKENGASYGNFQFHLAKDLHTGSNPSLKSYVGGWNCDQKSTLCVKEISGKGSLITPHESVPRKDRDVGENLIADLYNPVLNMDSDGVCCFKSKNVAFKRQKDFSFPCNYESNIVAQALPEVTENSISERADKVSELDPLDDIPMEIVKLLAENRRERRLLEAETTYHDTVCLSKSANRVKSARKVQSTQAYYNVKSKELWQNTFQVQEKSIGAEGGTCAETCLRILSPQQGVEGQNACFQTVVCGPTKINSPQRFAASPQKQRRTVDVDKYKTRNTEKPCACVQKKIIKSPTVAAPLNMHGNESMPAMQLLRLMDAGMSSRTSENSSKGFELVNFPRNNCEVLVPFSADQGKSYNVGEPLMHIPLIEKNVTSAQTGGKRCRISDTMASGGIKSQKKSKARHSGAKVLLRENRVKGHVPGNNSVCTNNRSLPANNLKKGLSTGVKAMEVDLVKNRFMDDRVLKKTGVGRPAKGTCRSEICSVNRNPAEFSIPGAGNKFMRRGGFTRRNENLGMIKSSLTSSRKRSGSMKQPIPTCVT